MALTAQAAWVFLPFVLPICLYVAYTDMKEMKIKNHAVLALAGVFLLLGLLVLPFDAYLWRLVHLLVMFFIGFGLTALGAMGAGDAKFIAAAAPFVALPDAPMVALLLAAVMIVTYVGHRAIRKTSIRNLAPTWESWTNPKFPMGLALGPALAIYLILGAVSGQ